MAGTNSFTLLTLLLTLFSCSSLLTQTSTSGSNEILRSEEDGPFEEFFKGAMIDYTAWLVQHDPFLPILETINLKSDKNVDSGVDADLIISKQYMEGHSKCLNSVAAAESDYEYSEITVTRRCVSNGTDIYVFGGEYTVNGTVAGPEKEIPFQGSGTWTIKTNETFQMGLIFYTINDDEYLNISETHPQQFSYFVDWTSVEFENLVLLGEAKKILNKEILNTINGVLGITYKRFISNSLSYPIINPPTRLLRTYLTEILSETKISDIIPDWTQPTTTSTTTMSIQTTEVNNESLKLVVSAGFLAFSQILFFTFVKNIL